MRTMFRAIFFVFSMVVIAATSEGYAREKIRVAVAANYIQAFKELSRQFEADTGVKIEATFTSSGTIYAQIVNGAPYDLFLSADEERPALLFKSGLVEKPFTYAVGRVILWSAKKDFCAPNDWRLALKGDRVKKIAIANPKTAPYGLAAMNALRKVGLWDALQKQLVNAQDIAQAFQYAATGAVDAGFCALSATRSKEGAAGCHYLVEEAQPMVQSGCVLKKSANKALAEKFAAYLASREAAAIKEKYGYR